MLQPKRLTLASLMSNLLTQFLAAREKKDKQLVSYFMITFDQLAEASYASEDGPAIGFLDNLVDCARDSLMDVDWKSTLPSIDSVDDIFPG